MVHIDTPSGWGMVRDPETDEDIDVMDGNEVDDDVADRLVAEYDRLERADEADDAGADNAADEAGGPDLSDVDTSGPDALADENASDVVDAVESGEADDYLDDLADADDRVTVQDAIESRREDL